MTEPKIDAKAVEAALLGCLFEPEELIDGQAPDNAVIVTGIIRNFGFHPDRLEAQREAVRAWLLELPHQFLRSVGGGWSFLNACYDNDGRQWGEHMDMENLFVLGLGLGLVAEQMPRDMWNALPGGMPYYVVND